MQFRITFGQKYRREPHPTLGFWPELVDGWLTVEADDEMAARNEIVSLIGPAYAFLYEETDPLPYNTAGDLGTLAAAVADPKPTSWTVGVQFTANADGTYELHVEDAADDLAFEGAPRLIVKALGDLTDHNQPVVSWVPRVAG